ncbi:hypothetical protein FQV27_15225 [Paracoccus aurantiacus]|uniref:C4-dicarboxylate ABC transporter substrate-binding protein n=1 Tax=Paracoccus aurantiacus TaxID=2599412 RepID=A0A5C6S0R5_9RHOB|nr:TRAP transporter substrate-binding protein DctP [Paracoccus aurantiacus]TXB67450.1 hypothetical protein FQV27_15225 [Paracoccus aurantiacus]
MKLTTFGLTLAGSAALFGTASAQELQYSTHLPPSVLVNSAGVEKVFDLVSKATGGEVTAKYFWAGQLYDSAGNFDAIRGGVIDTAFTQPASNQAEMPVNMMFSDLYHFGGDPYVTAAAVNATILLDCQSCRDEYAQANALFLGAHAATPAMTVCAREIRSIDDLRGLRIIGQQAVADWIGHLGSTQLDVPPPGQLEALERGTADCTNISPEWLTAFSIGEAAETIITAPIGSQFATSFMTMNSDTWAGLSDEAKTAFLQAMPQAIAAIVDGYVAADEEALAAAEEQGLTFTDLGGAYRQELDGFLSDYASRAAAKGEARGVADAAAIVAAFQDNIAKWQGIVD